MGGGNPLKKIEKQAKRSFKDTAKVHEDVLTLGHGEDIKKGVQDVTGITAAKEAEAAAKRMEAQQQSQLDEERRMEAERKRRLLRARRGRASLMSDDGDTLGV